MTKGNCLWDYSLPFGQVGQGTYDPEQHDWYWERPTISNCGIQATDVFWPCLPPTLPRFSSAPAPSKKVQQRNLTRRFPELIPAKSAIHEFEMMSPDGATEQKSFGHCLMGIGKARDVDRRGVNAAEMCNIVAVASGKAGEVLRLIRPHVKKLGWPNHAGIHIEVMDPSKPIDECYWAETGGSIQQIKFALEKDGTSNWLAGSSASLAVRQPNCTTIFRPIRRREQVPAIVPKNFTFKYPASRLTSNPIFSLPASKTGGFQHADVAFNPFYVKQFGIVDQAGFWSIWDMEGQEGQRTFKVEQTKHGRIYDHAEVVENQPQDQSENKYFAKNDDGWGRILWVGDVNTLVVCNRCYLAMFNIKAQPADLLLVDFYSHKFGWNLDVKQNVRQLDHFFLLTSTRIFWLECKRDQNGENIIGFEELLRWRHYKHERGENLKLEVLSEESSCTLILYGKENFVINTYRLTTYPPGVKGIQANSFACTNVSQTELERSASLRSTAHSISLIGTQYAGPAIINCDGTGPGIRYLEKDILFYQLFTLSADLELMFTLCSTAFSAGKLPLGSSKSEKIIAPTVIETKRNIRQSKFRQELEAFINDDSDIGVEDENQPHTRRRLRSRPCKQLGQRKPYTVNYGPVFDLLFGNVEDSVNTNLGGPPGTLHDLSLRIEGWKEQERPLLKSLIELMEPFSPTEDIDEVAAKFKDLMMELPEEDEVEAKKILSISQLNGSDSSLLTGLTDAAPDLIAVYNNLLEIWVTCLPAQAPGSVRLMKERLIRKVATELTLSSFAVSMKPPSQVQKPEEISEADRMELDSGTPFSSSQPEPIPESSQISSRTAIRDRGLFTPSYTSSSSDSSTYAGEGFEDPAMAVLRKYANFRPQPPPGPKQSRILSQWTLGDDPNQFSYEAFQAANAASDDGDEEMRLSQQARERRKRRAAKLNTKYKSYGKSESISQSQPPTICSSQPRPPTVFASQPKPPTIRSSQPKPPRIYSSPPPPSSASKRNIFGSQPAFAVHDASSQPSTLMTMTQVEQGRHGERNSFKRPPAKKRKQGF